MREEGQQTPPEAVVSSLGRSAMASRCPETGIREFDPSERALALAVAQRTARLLGAVCLDRNPLETGERCNCLDRCPLLYVLQSPRADRNRYRDRFVRDSPSAPPNPDPITTATDTPPGCRSTRSTSADP